jgi:hypothetical protein
MSGPEETGVAVRGGQGPPQCATLPAAPPIGDLLPHLRGVVVDRIDCTPSAVVIGARCWLAEAACPACGAWSSRVHSSYVRQVHDVPVGGRPVLIRLAMRRPIPGWPRG